MSIAPIHHHACVTVGHSMYVFGGIPGLITLTNTFHEFSFLTKEWRKVDVYNTPTLSDHSMTVLDSGIYVFGGRSDLDEFSSDMYVFNGTNQFEKVEISQDYIPSPRMKHSSVSNGERILIYGGTDRNTVFNDLYEFNPKSNEWKKISLNERSPRLEGHSSALFDNKLFLFGGYNGVDFNKFVHILDLETREWEDSIEAPNPPRAYQTATRFGDDKILIFGGATRCPTFGDMKDLDDTLGFDLRKRIFIPIKFSTDDEERVPWIVRPTPRHHHCAVSYHDRIYLFGGSHFSGEGSVIQLGDILSLSLGEEDGVADHESHDELPLGERVQNAVIVAEIALYDSELLTPESLDMMNAVESFRENFNKNMDDQESAEYEEHIEKWKKIIDVHERYLSMKFGMVKLGGSMALRVEQFHSARDRYDVLYETLEEESSYFREIMTDILGEESKSSGMDRELERRSEELDQYRERLSFLQVEWGNLTKEMEEKKFVYDTLKRTADHTKMELDRITSYIYGDDIYEEDESFVSFEVRDSRLTEDIIDANERVNHCHSMISSLTDLILEASQSLEELDVYDENFAAFEEISLELERLVRDKMDRGKEIEMLSRSFFDFARETFGYVDDSELLSESEDEQQLLFISTVDEVIETYRHGIHERRAGLETEIENLQEQLRTEKMRMVREERKIQRMKMSRDVLANEMARFAKKMEKSREKRNELEEEVRYSIKMQVEVSLEIQKLEFRKRMLEKDMEMVKGNIMRNEVEIVELLGNMEDGNLSSENMKMKWDIKDRLSQYERNLLMMKHTAFDLRTMLNDIMNREEEFDTYRNDFLEVKERLEVLIKEVVDEEYEDEL